MASPKMALCASWVQMKKDMYTKKHLDGGNTNNVSLLLRLVLACLAAGGRSGVRLAIGVLSWLGWGRSMLGFGLRQAGFDEMDGGRAGGRCW